MKNLYIAPDAELLRYKAAEAIADVDESTIEVTDPMAGEEE